VISKHTTYRTFEQENLTSGRSGRVTSSEIYMSVSSRTTTRAMLFPRNLTSVLGSFPTKSGIWELLAFVQISPFHATSHHIPSALP
jgi:hypothetical protein